MKKLIILILIAVVGVFYVQTQKPKPEVLGIPSISESQTKSGNTFNVCGWIPWWNYDKALSELTNYNHSVSIVSPFVFTLESDFSIRQRIPSDRLQLSSYTVIPTISSSNADTISEILNDDQLSQMHRNEIVHIVSDNNFDGIEIDYEHLAPSDKDAFTTFTKLLSEDLHAIGAKLIITLDPRSEVSYQDWEALGTYADSLRIMAYDYHWSTTNPGPLAPIEWVQEVTNRATVIPREKRILGIGLYGYEWNEEEGSIRALSLNAIQDRISEGASVIRTNGTSPSIYTATSEIWFEDSVSVSEKIALAQASYSGVCYWSLGDLPEELYTITDYDLDKLY